MVGFYNYTVYLTYIGLLSSLLGIFLAFTGNIGGAVICLLFSGLCDMFDGKIARTKKDRSTDEKRFGIQIDSLCDAVCFGVFPAFLGIAVGADRWWQIAVAALFAVCGVIRLAYFNVTEETRQDTTSANRREYLGIPITASAITAPVLLCFADVLGDSLPNVYTAFLAVLGLGYISPIRIKKPGIILTAVMLLVGVAVLIFMLCR